MKILKSFILIVLIALFTVPSFAQSTWDTGYNAKVSSRFMEYSTEVGKVITFHGTIDTVSTADTLISTAFDIYNYDDAITTYDPQFSGYLSGGSASTQKVSCQVWGSMSRTGTYTVLDTLLIADSVTTVITKTFDNNGKRFPWLKLYFFAAAGNSGDGTDFDFDIYFYKKD